MRRAQAVQGGEGRDECLVRQDRLRDRDCDAEIAWRQSGYLELMTRKYVATTRTRKYRDDLGDAEVKKRLTDEVAQVQSWCLPCGVLLYRERAKY
jgi:hypothetical protein